MADQKQREKCLREVDIMKKLNHPHIIKYIDSFIHNNELIIVTEWAERGDLKKLIKEKEAEDLQFDEPNIWELMKQIASALRHMHDKRIMHRDLKPANIFISNDHSLKIGDLGLGRSFSSETLEAYSKVGTPLYMSPELIQDSGYTENADVWSLGCICYELAELKSPFRNKEEKMSLMDLFDNITKCNYRPLDPRFSPQLREAIRNMIVVDPTKRWSSEQVENYALKCLEEVRKPLLDPIIAMDDISIKLGLLNYETNFCKAAERKPLHKLYFALEDSANQEPNAQLYYFLELAYWVMGLSKPDRKKDKLPVYTKTLIDWSSA
jgi:NIMA (never in mitosis gene a)-related kinase